MFGDETITLHYEEDLDDLATVSTDRDGVPIGGQVHVTVSDFRLNLDPTGEDVWIMNTNGDYGITVMAHPITEADNWVELFGGLGGEFTVTDDDGVVDITAGQTNGPSTHSEV